MADQIVSVRMPAALVEELKSLAQRNHFLDISEEIRSLLRENWIESQDPYAVKLTAIKDNLGKTTVPERLRLLKGDLRKFLEELDGI